MNGAKLASSKQSDHIAHSPAVEDDACVMVSVKVVNVW